MGEVCKESLSSKQVCFSGYKTPKVPVSATRDHYQLEDNARLLLEGLQVLNPSQACVDNIEPFLCLHLFGLCDESGVLHSNSREDCLDLRERVCAREWLAAERVLGDILPVCEDMPDTIESNNCLGKYNHYNYCSYVHNIMCIMHK